MNILERKCPFEVGDVVRVNSTPEELMNIGCKEKSSGRVGKIYKIVKGARHYKCKIESEDKIIHNYWFYEYMLEPECADLTGVPSEENFNLLFCT